MIVAGALLVLFAGAAQAQLIELPDGPGEYEPLPRQQKFTLNLEETELVVRTFKRGVAARLAHDHVVRANAFFGEVYFDQDTPEKSYVNVTARADKLVIDNKRARERYGLKGRVTESDKESIRGSMEAEDQLWVERYKFITFKSTKVTQNPDLTYRVEGDLTIRGKTQRIAITMHCDVRYGRFTGVGKTLLKHSMFGYEPYSAFLGAVANQDRFVLHVRVVGDPAS